MAITTHFQGQMSLEAGKSPILQILKYYSPWILSDPQFRRHFFPNFPQTSIKTLSMESVALMTKTINFKDQTSTRTYNPPPPFFRFLCAIVHGFLVIQNSNFIFVEIFCGRLLKRQLWRNLALTAKTANFQGQTSPWHVNPQFY